MPFNGSGAYSPPAAPVFPAVSGQKITSSYFNSLIQDIANALTVCVTKNGQSQPSSDLPMNGFKLTNVGSGSARGDSASIGNAQDGAYRYLGTISGTDTITASSGMTIPAYVAGQIFVFNTAGTNTTTSVTIAIDGLAAKAIQKFGIALSVGDMPARAFIYYDGTQFQLINPNLATEIRGNFYASANATGTANAITASFTPAITAVTANMRLFVRSASAATVSNPTFTPNSGTIAAQTIVKGANQALSVGDIPAGYWMILIWDATYSRWVLTNPALGVTPPQTGLQTANITTVTATTTLTAAANGGATVVANSASAITFTLYAANSVPQGKGIEILNINGGTATVQVAGSDVINTGYGTTTSITVNQGGRLLLESDGSGTFYTSDANLPFEWETSYYANTIITIAHGFGVKPKMVMVYLKNTTAELGYNPGDEATWAVPDGSILGPGSWSFDATNIYIPTGELTARVQQRVASSSANWVNVTAANWNYIIRAWKQ